VNLLTLKTTLTTLLKKLKKTAPKLLKVYLQISSGKSLTKTALLKMKTVLKSQMLRDKRTVTLSKKDRKKLKHIAAVQKKMIKTYLKKYPQRQKTAYLRAQMLRNKRKMKL